jgi:hypothetical protein
MIKSQLEALQFVLRSDDRGLVPAFGCLHFYEGRVQTSSGTITFDAPWPGNPLDVTVPMNPVIKCLQAAPEEKARIVVNKAGNISIKAGDYSSRLVPFLEEFPRAKAPSDWPADVAVSLDAKLWNGKLLPALELLRPFVSPDATRPWSQYVVLRGGKLFATNNVALARIEITELQSIKYDVVFDMDTIDHILRIRDLGHEVTSIILSPENLLCEFGDGAWTSYRGRDITWPGTAPFDALLGEGKVDVPAEMAQKVSTMASIAGTATDGVIYVYEHGAMTQMDNTIARVWCGAHPRGSYMRSSLQQMLAVADKWSPGEYPSPVQFSGKGVKGILLGMRGASDAIDTLLRGDLDESGA